MVDYRPHTNTHTDRTRRTAIYHLACSFSYQYYRLLRLMMMRWMNAMTFIRYIAHRPPSGRPTDCNTCWKSWSKWNGVTTVHRTDLYATQWWAEVCAHRLWTREITMPRVVSIEILISIEREFSRRGRGGERGEGDQLKKLALCKISTSWQYTRWLHVALALHMIYSPALFCSKLQSHISSITCSDYFTYLIFWSYITRQRNLKQIFVSQ